MDRKKKIKWVAGFGLLVATVALAVPPRVIINPSGGDVEFRRPTSGGNSELVGKIGTTAGAPMEFNLGVQIPSGQALNLAGMTASQAVFTDASKNLISNAITGTGNVVMSTSPSLTTPTLSGGTLSGTIAGTPTWSGLNTYSAGIKITGGTAATETIARTAANTLNINNGAIVTSATITTIAQPVTISLASSSQLALTRTGSSSGTVYLGTFNGALLIGTSTGSAEIATLSSSAITLAKPITAGVVNSDNTLYGPLKFNNGSSASDRVMTIAANTADGSDNHNLELASGGLAGPTRGAYISLFGNEADFGASLQGQLRLISGYSSGTTPAEIQIRPGNVEYASFVGEAITLAQPVTVDVTSPNQLVLKGTTTAALEYKIGTTTTWQNYATSSAWGLYNYGISADVLNVTSAGAVTIGPASGTATVQHSIKGYNFGDGTVAILENRASDYSYLEFKGTTTTLKVGLYAAQGIFQGIYGKTSGSGTAVLVNSAGILGTTTSIREAKTNIHPLNSTIGWLTKLKPVVYQYRKQVDGKYTDEAEDFVNTGLIYDEVVQVNPGLVFDTADGKPSGVAYERLITPLLRGLQEQQAIIDALKTQIRCVSIANTSAEKAACF